MKVSIVLEAFRQSLTDYAKQEGLLINRSSGDLSYKSKDFSACFSIFRSVYDEVWVYPHLFVEYKALRRLARVVVPQQPHLLDAVNINLLVLKDYLSGGVLYKKRGSDPFYVLQSERDITSFLMDYKELVQMGLEYINKNCSTLMALNQIYNTNPFWKENPHCAWYYNVCFLGPAIAKLSKDPNYLHLRDQYIHIVESENVMPDEDSRKAFYKMIEVLDSK